jgi:hypothetical protein
MVATWPGGIDSPPSITLHNTCYRTLRMIGPVSPKKMPGAKTEAPGTSHLVLFYGAPPEYNIAMQGPTKASA